MDELEERAARYVESWKKQNVISVAPGGRVHGLILRGNNFGSEGYRLFAKDTDIDDVDYTDLGRLVLLLNRTLAAQTNQDHEWFWRWTNCVLQTAFPEKGPMARPLITGDVFFKKAVATLIKHEKDHVLAAPLAFAVLEGLVRRLCSDFVGLDGSVKKAFQIKNRAYVTVQLWTPS